jgi:hypothetical protein
MYPGAFSHGLTACIIFRLIAVTDRAASGWELGMPYLLLYELGSRLCSARCLDNCLIILYQEEKDQVLFSMISISTDFLFISITNKPSLGTYVNHLEI